jgi:DNA polymerase elongation subunit (family B)
MSKGLSLKITPMGEFFKFSKHIAHIDDDIVKSITQINASNTYVYDLETDVGRFHAGIGKIIVKNTDSNFYECNLSHLDNPNISLQENKRNKLIEAMKIGQLISQEVNKAINKPDIMNFAYEKIACPCLLVKKKGYYYRKYEDNPDKYKDVVMGLATKRRNYCDFTKDTIQKLLDLLMESTTPNPSEVIDYINKRLDDLINNKVDLNQLVITNSIKDNYKNPEGQAHYVLAQRMKARGETVNSNDRIAYIFSMIQPQYNTKGNPVKPLDSVIVEEINYAKENGIRYDPEKYIAGQITEPTCQILDYIMDNPGELFNDAIKRAREEKIKIYGKPKIPTRKGKEKI